MHREIERRGFSRKVDVAVAVDGDAHRGISGDAAQKRRVRQDGIDHERQAMIVAADAESDAARVVDDEATLDRVPCTVFVLVHDRRRLMQVAPLRCDRETAIGIDGDVSGAIDCERDVSRLRARRHDEVVFELALVPVIDDVDAGIDAGVLDFAIAVNASLPQPRIAADQMVRDARQRLQTAAVGPSGANEPHRDRGGRGLGG